MIDARNAFGIIRNFIFNSKLSEKNLSDSKLQPAIMVFVRSAEQLFIKPLSRFSSSLLNRLVLMLLSLRL